MILKLNLNLNLNLNLKGALVALRAGGAVRLIMKYSWERDGTNWMVQSQFDIRVCAWFDDGLLDMEAESGSLRCGPPVPRSKVGLGQGKREKRRRGRRKRSQTRSGSDLLLPVLDGGYLVLASTASQGCRLK